MSADEAALEVEATAPEVMILVNAVVDEATIDGTAAEEKTAFEGAASGTPALTSVMPIALLKS